MSEGYYEVRNSLIRNQRFVSPPEVKCKDYLCSPAVGKSVQCLAKLGDDLYLEASKDGVSYIQCVT